MNTDINFKTNSLWPKEFYRLFDEIKDHNIN